MYVWPLQTCAYARMSMCGGSGCSHTDSAAWVILPAHSRSLPHIHRRMPHSRICSRVPGPPGQKDINKRYLQLAAEIRWYMMCLKFAIKLNLMKIPTRIKITHRNVDIHSMFYSMCRVREGNRSDPNGHLLPDMFPALCVSVGVCSAYLCTSSHFLSLNHPSQLSELHHLRQLWSTDAFDLKSLEIS